MTRGAAQIDNDPAGWWLLRLLLPVFFLFVLTVSIALFQVVRQTNTVEAERSRLAIAAIVSSKIAALTDSAYDNANWDDAAKAVYQPVIDTEFTESAWMSATVDGPFFHQLMVLDAKGKPLISYSDGKETEADFSKNIRKSISLLRTKMIKTGRPAGGLVKTQHGIDIIGMAEIVPSSARYKNIIPRAGAYHLIAIEHFSPTLVSEIGNTLMLDDMKLGSKPDGNHAITLHDIEGHPIRSISWSPTDSGTAAFFAALPFVLIAAVLHLGLAGFTVSRGYRQFSQLGKQIAIDSLSQLPNRRALRHAIIKAEKRKESIAIALIDLDGFKAINDSHGHGVGDQLLRACADEIKESAALEALAVRLGGDEFAIFISGSTTKARIEAIGYQLLERFSNPISIAGRSLKIGVSIGLAHGTVPKIAGAEILRRADTAMYVSKRTGKMRLTWYDDTHDTERLEKSAIAQDLRKAIDAKEICVAYQPIVSSQSGQILSLEALVRWNSPERGEISPITFIPLAEESGLIDEIGAMIFDLVALDCRDWRDIPVSINVSQAQMRSPMFLALLNQWQKQSGISAERIELEIRESVLLFDTEKARNLIDGARALGFGVAFDNFGSGQAALNLIAQGGFTKLKIDRLLVAAAAENSSAQAILQSSIAVAKSLGMAIVAVGIETPMQAQMMRMAGCDALQGRFISKPLNAAAISNLLPLQDTLPVLRKLSA